MPAWKFGLRKHKIKATKLQETVDKVDNIGSDMPKYVEYKQSVPCKSQLKNQTFKVK
jgi:hypothetical protein